MKTYSSLQVERVHAALREQKSVCAALEKRLVILEGPHATTTHNTHMHGELEERIEECEALRVEIAQVR